MSAPGPCGLASRAEGRPRTGDRGAPTAHQGWLPGAAWLGAALLLGGIALAVPTAGAEAPEPTIPEGDVSDLRALAALARAAAAIGGVPAVGRVRTARLHATVESAGMAGEFLAVYDVAGRYAERSRLGPRSTVITIRGAEGWTARDRGAALPLAPGALQARMDALFFDTWGYLDPRRGARVRDLQRASSVPMPCRWFRVRGPGTSERDLCLADTHGLPVVQEFRDAESGSQLHMEFGDFRPVAGVLWPYQIRVVPQSQPRNAVALRVRSWDVNGPVDDADFSRPVPRVERALDPTVSIPLRFDGRHLAVDAYIGETGPWSLLVDTGSTLSLLDRDTAASLDLLPAGERTLAGPAGPIRATLVDVADVALPGVPLPRWTWAVASLADDLGLGDSTRFDGILGADLLRQFVLRLEADSGSLRLFEGSTYEHGSGGIPLTLQPGLPVPAVSLRVGGREAGAFVLDTGSDRVVLGSTPPLLGLRQEAGAGWLLQGSQPLPGRGPRPMRIDLGPLSVAAVLVDTSRRPLPEGVAGLLGMSFLRRFVWTVDWFRGVVWVDPAPLYSAPDRIDTSGLRVERRQGAWCVVGVLPASPAGAAAVPLGATVVSLGGVPAADLTDRVIFQVLTAGAGPAPVLEVVADRRRTRHVLHLWIPQR